MYDIDVTGNLDPIMDLARRDDWYKYFVGSDIRQLIARCQNAEKEIEQLIKEQEDILREASRPQQEENET